MHPSTIQNKSTTAGMTTAQAKKAVAAISTTPVYDLGETLGSPAFLDQAYALNLGDRVDGWDKPEIQAVIAARRPPPPDGGGPSGGGGPGASSKPPPSNGGSRSSSTAPKSGGNKPPAGPSSISGSLPLRPASPPKPKEGAPDRDNRSRPTTRLSAAKVKADANTKANVGPGHRPGSGTPPTPPDLGLPRIGEFLVMHRFGPWKTNDMSNMKVFIRRLLGLMPELKNP
ncbi:predicted protein [Chaetomium globosum CBS 148.51]|uniref:Uncharacterized protein n=1 Tax=Chaetomium globosum (strain ATCC 6205 / CBS 148.51 / DSM 1962 / NBRC 6347 / NRRL 1970) TaxID=306901 RepID=Q2GQJ1_CHAGB|nr:uncharacterized protein CHGG_09763 [Chaetomium globosum CBS 148.51]EAQ83359.1 predicted protein [Chaetomium globosum CBS 148.51]